MDMNGNQKLSSWFGLSRASFTTLPRVLMEAMPDEWQSKMADLLTEYDEAWDTDDCPTSIVSARQNGKFTTWPAWVLNYRYPDLGTLQSRRRHNTQDDRTER